MADKDIELDVNTGEEIRDEELEQDEEGNVSSESGEDTEESSDDHVEEGEGEGSTDDEREAIRERRRQERKHRKEAQREREDTLRRELAARDAVINELRSKVEVIERRDSSSEVAQIENVKKQTAQAYQYFKDQIRIATEQGNGAAVADATEKMMQAQRKFDEISNYEKAVKQRRAAPQALDPRLVNNAQEWMQRNSWYDPTGKDQDSRITLTIDQRMAEEGWDPTTKEYWQELESRVKKYLPHRKNSGKISNKPRSVVAGSGRESGGSSSNAGSYKLSAERVQALKDAGIWDDAKQRAEAVKRFREYDKQNQG